MYTKMDEYFIHQTIDTLDHVESSDPRFQERAMFNIHGRDHAMNIHVGCGSFPNMNLMENYVNARNGSIQYQLLMSRELNHDREVMKTGPLELEVIEPLKKWGIYLAENECGVSFDLEFTGRTEILETNPPIFIRNKGWKLWHQLHVRQSGFYKGKVKMDGKEFEVKDWWGSRDRSLGIRGNVPGVNSSLDSGANRDSFAGPFIWMSAQFDDRVIEVWVASSPDGKPHFVDGAVSYVGGSPEAVPFVSWEYEYILDDNKKKQGIIFTFTDAEGKKTVVEQRPTGHIYSGPFRWKDQGGIGVYRGKEVVEGYRFDQADPADFKKYVTDLSPVWFLHSLSEYKSEGDTGIGILESFDYWSLV